MLQVLLLQSVNNPHIDCRIDPFLSILNHLLNGRVLEHLVLPLLLGLLKSFGPGLNLLFLEPFFLLFHLHFGGLPWGQLLAELQNIGHSVRLFSVLFLQSLVDGCPSFLVIHGLHTLSDHLARGHRRLTLRHLDGGKLLVWSHEAV